jgi:hypothetical protein
MDAVLDLYQMAVLCRNGFACSPAHNMVSRQVETTGFCPHDRLRGGGGLKSGKKPQS